MPPEPTQNHGRRLTPLLPTSGIHSVFGDEVVIKNTDATKHATPNMRFPPPANAAYDLSPDHREGQYLMRKAQYDLGHSINATAPTERSGNSLEIRERPNHFGESIYPPPTDGVARLIAKASMEKDDKGAQVVVDLRSKGEKLADTINFTRRAWFTETPGVSGIICSAEDQRRDFIGEIDEGAELEYCSKCKTKHIPPGPPITLQDRDTCGSYLPEWFPADKISNPWDAFTGLMNEYVRLDEISQGYSHRQNPDRKEWDLQFHEPHDKWKQVGRKGGWWKCRDGPNAQPVEQDCRLCHRNNGYYQEPVYHKTVAERKADIMAFIEKRMRIVGEKDKALALAQIRAEGFPEHLGMIKYPAHIIPSIPHPDTPPVPMDHYVTSGNSVNPTEICFTQNRSRRKPLEF